MRSACTSCRWCSPPPWPPRLRRGRVRSSLSPFHQPVRNGKTEHAYSGSDGFPLRTAVAPRLRSSRCGRRSRSAATQLRGPLCLRSLPRAAPRRSYHGAGFFITTAILADYGHYWKLPDAQVALAFCLLRGQWCRPRRFAFFRSVAELTVGGRAGLRQMVVFSTARTAFGYCHGRPTRRPNDDRPAGHGGVASLPLHQPPRQPLHQLAAQT